MNAVAEKEAPVSVNFAHDSVFNMLRQGAIGEAVSAFDAAIARWPANPKLLLLKGDVLAHSAGAPKAAVHYASLLKNPATAPWAGKRLLAVLRAGPLPIEDAVLVAREACQAPTDRALREGVLDSLLAREAADEKFRLLEIAGTSGIFKYESKLAVALTERGDFDGALAVLSHAESEGRTTFHSAILKSDLLAVASRLPEAVTLLKGFLTAHPGEADVYRRLTMFLQRVRDFDGAADVFEAAVRRWPHDWMLLYRLNRLPIARDRMERILDIVATGADDLLETNDRFRFQFALACLHVGQIGLGMALLEQPFAPPVSILAAPVKKALMARSGEAWLAHSRLTDDRTREVQITRSPKARATVVLTTGIAFGNLPPAFIDTLFAEHGCNAVYLRDFGKRAYLRGISALGADEAHTIAALKGIVADLGAKRTIAMGSSSGGFSALRYGALMGADVAVSFSGPTALSQYFDSARPSAWNPDYFVRALLERERDLPFDLVPVLSTPRPTEFLQFYGADSAEDARQARRLEGLPGVTLTAVSGVDDHYVVDHMIGDGSFEKLLDRLADQRTTPPVRASKSQPRSRTGTKGSPRKRK